MGRPSNPQTRYFQRTLTNPQRMILLAAGKGNLCRGFENVLDLYSEAHNKGFRPERASIAFKLTTSVLGKV